MLASRLAIQSALLTPAVIAKAFLLCVFITTTPGRLVRLPRVPALQVFLMTAGSCLQLRQRRSFRSRPLTPGVFFAEQPLIEPVAHEQHNYCKRQCAADGGGLQCAEPTGNEQYGSNHAL